MIPAFNDAAVVTTAIRSALDQPLATSVIVVDDGSTDDTADAASRVRDDRMQVVRMPNGGPGGARNAGAAAATASHVVFLDADDELLPGALEAFAEHHAAGMVLVRSGVMLVGNGQPERLWLPEASPHPFPRGTPLPGTFSVDREVFLAAGGYDPKFRYGENSELLLRLAMAASPARTALIDTPTVRKVDRSDRQLGFYAEHRFAAALRMLEVHSETLRSDRASLANHHAIASKLARDRGMRVTAARHALATARLTPTSMRAWGRVAGALVPRRLRPGGRQR